jgi:hypothetical protein
VLSVTRATATLIGIGVAGFLLWLASTFDSSNTGSYWIIVGLLAAAGFVMALSQLLGGWTKWGMPRVAGPVFLLAFVPALVVVGWVVLSKQPHANWFQRHAVSWGDDLGVGGLRTDLALFLSALVFGLGLVFGFTLDTAGPRRRERPVVPAEPVVDPVPEPVAEPDPEPPPRNEEPEPERL